jgi:hypothetical protein
VVEEVPDEEEHLGRPSLPEGTQALLMTEEEYENTLKGGKSTIPPTKTKQKPDGKEPSTAKATAGNPPSTKNSSRNGKRTEYADHDVQHCQPTTSRTKVEDLVTNDEEEETIRKEQAQHAGYRSFRDRPTPKPQFEWTYDPRMPAEWNEVISTMREHEGAWSHQTQSNYHKAMEEEISTPEDFRYPEDTDNVSMDQVKAQNVTRLHLGREDWNFKKLRARFERPRSIATKLNIPEGPARPLVSKGKQRDPEELPLKDEYSHLWDHWRDDYADILDGT